MHTSYAISSITNQLKDTHNQNQTGLQNDFSHNLLHGFGIIPVGQLAWLVHMIGHVMGVRISHTTSSDYDTMDGQLVCR